MDSFEYSRTGELFSFLAKDRVRLTGFLMNGKRTKKCVIYMHGLSSNFTGQTPVELSRYFASAGYATFAANNRGSGTISHMFRVRNGKRVRFIGGTDYEIFEDSWKDIAGAIDTLRKRGFREFVLCGHSTGCQKAVYYQFKTGDRRVNGLILLAPADDYNLQRKSLGRKFARIAREARRMSKGSRKGQVVPGSGSYFSAQRLDSQLDLKRVEARIFNYDGELKEFSRIRIPIFATFGDKEEYALKDVRVCLRLLSNKSSSSDLTTQVIKGADHGFTGRLDQLGRILARWLRRLS